MTPDKLQAFAGPIGAGIGMVGNIVSGIMSSRAQKKAMQFQSRENQKQRDFQKQMAEYQTETGRENWRMQNLYDAPASERQRLEAAGLNPDLIYGGGAGNLASPSPVMAGPAGSAPGLAGGYGTFNRSPLGESISRASELSLLGAQVSALNAQARKDNTQAGVNASQEALNHVSVSTEQEKANLYKSQRQYYDASVNEIRANIERIHAEIDKFNAEADNYTALAHLNENEAQAVYKRLEVADATIRELASRTALNYQQVRNGLFTIYVQKCGIAREDMLALGLRVLYDEQAMESIMKQDWYQSMADLNKVDATLKESWGDTKNFLECAKMTSEIWANIGDGIGSVLQFKKPKLFKSQSTSRSINENYNYKMD